jgi:hypothetical protein
MKQLIDQVGFTPPVASRMVPEEDIVRGILQESKDFDLVILHSQRHQTAAEGFGFSSITSSGGSTARLLHHCAGRISLELIRSCGLSQGTRQWLPQ